jgi:hypothetical protein
MIAKIDHRFSENDLLTGRYYFGDSDQSFPLALVGGGILPGFNTVTPTRVNIISLSHTHIFNPRLLTEIRFGYNRFHETFGPEDSTFDPSSIGLNMGTTKAGFRSSSINVSGFAPLGANTSVPRGRTDSNTQFNDNFTWAAGKHNWKFGYEFRRTFVDGFFDSGYRGKLSFDDLTPLSPARLPAAGRHRATLPARRLKIITRLLQDTFRFSQHVTLSYGLRWEYFGVIGEEKNRFSLIDSAGNVNTVKQLYPRDLNNFAPRASIAWDAHGNGKTVVRAGWGMYYDAFSQDFFVGQLPFNTFNSGPAITESDLIPSRSASLLSAPSSRRARVRSHKFCGHDVFTVDQKLRTPYIHVMNLEFAAGIDSKGRAASGYVGSQGRKLFRYIDINQINPATGTRYFLR